MHLSSSGFRSKNAFAPLTFTFFPSSPDVSVSSVWFLDTQSFQSFFHCATSFFSFSAFFASAASLLFLAFAALTAASSAFFLADSSFFASASSDCAAFLGVLGSREAWPFLATFAGVLVSASSSSCAGHLRLGVCVRSAGFGGSTDVSSIPVTLDPCSSDSGGGGGGGMKLLAALH